MLNTIENLKKILQQTINDNIDNPKINENILAEFITKGFDVSKVDNIFKNGIKEEWDNLSQYEQIAFIQGIKHTIVVKDLRLLDYYGENLYNEYQQIKVDEKNIKNRIANFNKLIKVDDFHYIGKISYKEIYDLYTNGNLFYNIESQRDSKIQRLGKKGMYIKTFNVNHEKTDEISQLMIEGKYKPDTIILNCRIIPKKEMNFKEKIFNEVLSNIEIKVDYNNSSINQTIIDIVDGMHRIEGCVKAVGKNFATNNEWLDGYLYLNLVFVTVEEAREIVAQTFERSDLKDDDYKELLKSDENTLFLDKLINSVDILKNNVSVKYDELRVEKKLTYKGLLLRTLKSMNLDIKSRSKMTFIEKEISKNYNDIIDYLKVNLFNDNLEQMKKDSCLLDINMFSLYLQMANELRGQSYDVLIESCNLLYKMQKELNTFKLNNKSFAESKSTQLIKDIVSKAIKEVG